jgi:hypothetical protein
MKMRSTLVRAALPCLAITLPGSNALAQQKQQVSFKSSAEHIRFTQQQNIEVRDVPNHIVRSYEGRTTFPSNAPVINGVKIVEEWDTGTGDRIEGNGLDKSGHRVQRVYNGEWRQVFCSIYRTGTEQLGDLHRHNIRTHCGWDGKASGNPRDYTRRGEI